MNEHEFEQQLNELSERVLSQALTSEEETNYAESLFESIRHVNEYGEDFWYARELQNALDYKEWRNFQNYGYRGLYGGLSAKDIHDRKGLKKSQKILDHMGYEELAANLFRATQTEAKLRRENIQGKANANQTHFDVGKEVRDTIKRLGGTMPEDLATPEKSIQQIERQQKITQID